MPSGLDGAIDRRTALASLLGLGAVAPAVLASFDPPKLQRRWFERAAVVRSRGWTIRTDLPRNALSPMSQALDRAIAASDASFGRFELRVPDKRSAALYASRRECVESVRIDFAGRFEAAEAEFIAGMGGPIAAGAAARASIDACLEQLIAAAVRAYLAPRFEGTLPAWLDHGLGGALSTLRAGRGGAIDDGWSASMIEQANRLIDERNALPLERLVRSAAPSRDIADGVPGVDVLPLQATLFVRFLLSAAGGRSRDRLIRLLARLNVGTDPDRATIESLEIDDWAAVNGAWTAWIRALEPSPAADRFEAMMLAGEGAAHLLQLGAAPSSWNDLRDALIDERFSIDVGIPFARRRIRAEMLEPSPADARTGIEWRASTEAALPAVILNRAGPLVTRWTMLGDAPLFELVRDRRP